MDLSHITYKTTINIPITKESSRIYSEDASLMISSVRQALEYEQLKIKHGHFTTVAHILESLGVKYAAENCSMIVYQIDKYKYENGYVTICYSYAQMVSRYNRQ